MSYFDAHTHIQFKPYDLDRAEVIARAKNAGVKMIMVGTQMSTSEAGIRMAEEYPEDIWAAVAVHPSHFVSRAHWYHDSGEQSAAEPEEFDPVRLLESARHPRVVAIGECGLDYFRLKGTPAEIEETKHNQQEAFVEHIAIARAVGKPLMIHCRDAFFDLIPLLKKEALDLKPGVVHFFTGSLEDAKELLALHYSFTFGGVTTFTHDYDEIIRFIPAAHILSETDAPYVAPVPYRGKRNEPAYVVETVKKLAELKGLSEGEMKDQIFANAERIFAL